MSEPIVLMRDAFESLRVGVVKPAVWGPHMEMHAQPASEEDNLGGWSNRVGGWGLPAWPWAVVETAEGKRLESSASATCADNTSIAKGDLLWRDYTVAATAQLLPPGAGWGGPAGVVFRFLDSQRFCAAVVDADGMAKILRRVESSWDLLAAAAANIAVGEPFEITVQVAGADITARVGPVELCARDGEIERGCVGFVGSRPVRFGAITVTAAKAEAERVAAEAKRIAARIADKRARYGKPAVWRKYDTAGFGTGRRIRLGDLTGDGRIDFLLPRLAGKHKHGIGLLTAMSADGEVLWRLGEDTPAKEIETSGDGAVQIHDIDGDGRNEVVCAWDGRLCVYEGATGELKYSAGLPAMKPICPEFKGSINHWGGGYNDEGPTVVPSSICFADLAGRGAPRDVLLGDNYHTLVAMTPEFKELWRTVCSHGHFPQAYDFDHDGRESVLAGYQHLSPDGELLGRVCLTDHQDAIYAGPLEEGEGAPDKILMAGGEDGLLLLTAGYDIRQRFMGHVQRLAVGRFREDLPGLCVATVLFHGNPGIVRLFDSCLRKVWTRDYPVVGATLQPVNWDGSGVELMLLSGVRPAHGHAGGLIDGAGELAVPLPDDGGPGLCAYARDFDGDGLDELMLWDHERIWIYHTDSAPPPGPTYRPLRPPLYNMSNFQSYWSRPRWEG